MSLLASIPAFQDLPPPALDRLERGSTRLEPHHGRQIFAQGDPADAVYVVLAGDGVVRIGVADRRSKNLIVEVFRRGDVFGEIGVLDGSVRTAEALVEGRVQVARIGAAAFLAVLRDTPELGQNLSRLLASRLRRTFSLFQYATFESLEVRLARQVLYFAERHGRQTERGPMLSGRFRQSDLADLLGATPRSIITILNAWRAGGLVAYDAARGQLTLTGEAGLRALAGPDDLA